METKIELSLQIYFKRGRTLRHVTPQEASRMMSGLRWRALNEGMSPDDVGVPQLFDSNGRRIGEVSWNSRVWVNNQVVYEPTDEDLNYGR